MVKINKKEADILKKISISPKPMPLEDIKGFFDLTERSLKASLQNVADFLNERDMKNCLSVNNKTLSLTEGREKISGILKSLSRDDYYIGKVERINVIYFQFIAGFHMTLDEIADFLQVGKTTVKSCLPFVRNMIKAYELKLENIIKFGLIVTGDEREIRKALLDFLYLNFKPVKSQDSRIVLEQAGVNPYLRELAEKMLSPEILEQSVRMVDLLKSRLNIDNDEIYNIEVLVIGILLYRSASGNLIDEAAEVKINERAFELSEQITHEVNSVFGSDFCRREFDDFIVLLNKGYLICNSDVEQNSLVGSQVIIQRTVSDIISENLNNNLKLPDILNNEIVNALDMLYEHMYKAVERLRTGVCIQNPFLSDIRQNYSQLFNLISDKLSDLERLLEKSFSNDEVGYITLLTENLLTVIMRASKNIKQIVLVCGAGYGTSQIIKEKIERLFDVKIVDVIPFHKLDFYLQSFDVDLFISTVPLKQEDKRIVEVSPLITATDIEKLKKAGMKELVIDFDELMEIIEKNCLIKNEYALISGLKQILNIKESQSNKYNRLLSLIHEGVIALLQTAFSWQEAIRMAGELLYQNGNIELSYIDDMIDNIRKFGSYITLGKGVALPHARNRNNVIKTGFSIVTLKEPVLFDNGNLVDVIICFCSKNRGEYEEALIALMELIEYHDLLNYKNVLETPHQFITFIENICSS